MAVPATRLQQKYIKQLKYTCSVCRFIEAGPSTRRLYRLQSFFDDNEGFNQTPNGNLIKTTWRNWYRSRWFSSWEHVFIKTTTICVICTYMKNSETKNQKIKLFLKNKKEEKKQIRVIRNWFILWEKQILCAFLL